MWFMDPTKGGGTMQEGVFWQDGQLSILCSAFTFLKVFCQHVPLLPFPHWLALSLFFYIKTKMLPDTAGGCHVARKTLLGLF